MGDNKHAQIMRCYANCRAFNEQHIAYSKYLTGAQWVLCAHTAHHC